MKVFVKGQGPVTLTQQHFLAAGGQASVYVRDSVAYKVYANKEDAIPHDKFQALSAISDPCVIKPKLMLLNPKNDEPIGYAMSAVSDALSLCQLFTRSFRDRNRITEDTIVNVASRLRDHVVSVHQAGILVVDLNEFNVLVSKAFAETYLIDVDSFQAPGYPATVIMPSVRDWKTKGFTETSDWFSYGVLAFQLFVGAHPYKGTHLPSASIAKEFRLEHRMKNAISAFRPDVKLPRCCYPLDAIPQAFREWLKAVLEDGKRVMPPDPKGGPVPSVVASIRVVVTGGDVEVTEVLDFDRWTVLSYAESGTHSLALLRRDDRFRFVMNGMSVGGNVPDLKGVTLVGFTPKLDRPVALNLDGGRLTFIDLERGLYEVREIRADEVAKAGNRFYVRSSTRVLEVDLVDVQSPTGLCTVFTASHSVADVLPLASRLYEGCVIQNMLGSVFVSLFPRSRAGHQVRMTELDEYKVQDARFERGVLMVMGAKNGRYDRLVFRFDERFEGYDVRIAADVDPSEINFVVLSTGVCVTLTESEKLEVFAARKDSSGLREVENNSLGSDMLMTHVGGKAGFVRGSKVCRIGLRSS